MRPGLPRRIWVPCVLGGAFICAAILASTGADRESTVATAAGLPAARSASVVLLGQPTVEASTASAEPGAAEAFPLLARASGSLTSLHIFIGQHNTASELIVGLYSSLSGQPARRLSLGDLRRPESGRWNSVHLTPVSITTKHMYWVALLGRGGEIAVGARTRGCAVQHAIGSQLRSLPELWRSRGRISACPISAYGEGRVLHATLPTTPKPTSPATPASPQSPAGAATPSASPAPTGATDVGAAGTPGFSLAPGALTAPSISTTAPPSTPVNVVAPLVSGYATAPATYSPGGTFSMLNGDMAIPASELSVSPGTWSGDPSSYTFQWQHCLLLVCTNVSEAPQAGFGKCSSTSFCYVVQSSDLGNTMQVVVTAQNANGATSVVSSSTPTAGQQVSLSEPVPCQLSSSAVSCWAADTGVADSGCTEAQIEAQSPAGCASPYWERVAGNVTITTPGTVIDHEWISGCIAIDANNVTIRDALITPNGADCSGGQGGSSGSAVNDGNQSSVTGLVLQDVNADGGNKGGYGVSLAPGTCIRCNAFGFDDNFWGDGLSSSDEGAFMGSFSHDLSTLQSGAHQQTFMFDSASYIDVEDSYAISNGLNGQVEGAMNIQGDEGVIPNNITVDGTYMEGTENGSTDMIENCTSTNIHITDDVFSTDVGNVPQTYWNDDTGTLWSGNSLSTGAPYPDPGDINCHS